MNVKEIWTEVPKSGKGKKKARVVNKDRFIPKVGKVLSFLSPSYSYEVIAL